MITLKFHGENGDKIFQFLYDGMIVGGALVKEKGMTVIRREASILNKMDEISKECECGRKEVTGEPARELLDKENEFMLNLTFDEYDILKNYFESVPWKSAISRDIVKISDWLEGQANAEARSYEAYH